MRSVISVLILVLVSVTILTAGCVNLQGGPKSVGEHGENLTAKAKIKVVVSILPQKEFVERVGADKVDVSVMIPPGASPATYEPTAQQLKNLADADIYVRIGHVPFEKAHISQFVNLNPKMKVVDSSEGIDIIGNDPHIWLSPILVKTQVQNIYTALAEFDPENAAEYEQNAQKYLSELDELHEELSRTLSQVKNKKLIVFHPAWGYFAREYGFEQIAIEVEGKDPTAEQLARIIDTARENGVKVVFVQKQFSTRSAESVAQAIGGVVVPIDPLSENYIENMREVAQKIEQYLSQ